MISPIINHLAIIITILCTSYASGNVVCDPQFPGGNTNCACADDSPGCDLPDCVDRCTCLGGGCAMPICLTNCICPDGGCMMDACVDNCDQGGDLTFGFGEPTQEPEESCAVGAPCSEEWSSCTDGTTETCCGETYDSFRCDCMMNGDGNLEYACMFTDACFGPCESEPPVPETPIAPKPTPAPVATEEVPTPPTLPTDPLEPVDETPAPTDAPLADTETPTAKPVEGSSSSAKSPLVPWGYVKSAATYNVAAAIVWSFLG